MQFYGPVSLFLLTNDDVRTHLMLASLPLRQASRLPDLSDGPAHHQQRCRGFMGFPMVSAGCHVQAEAMRKFREGFFANSSRATGEGNLTRKLCSAEPGDIVLHCQGLQTHVPHPIWISF